MFDFGIESLKLTKPSLEGEQVVIVPEANIKPRADAMEMSDGVVSLMRSGVIRGLLTAYAVRMVLAGLEKEKITEKLNAFIEQCAKAGDLDLDQVKWLRNEDWYQSVQWRSDAYRTYENYSDSMLGLYRSALEDAIGVRTYIASYSSKLKDKMTANEKAILDNFNKARDAYYEAEKIRDQYFGKQSAISFLHILRKYAETLGNLDKELFEFLMERATEDLKWRTRSEKDEVDSGEGAPEAAADEPVPAAS